LAIKEQTTTPNKKKEQEDKQTNKFNVNPYLFVPQIFGESISKDHPSKGQSLGLNPNEI